MVAPATELGYAIGNADLSEDMALRIEKAFGVKMDTLMRMQSSYDIARTRKREKEIRIRRIHRTSDIHSCPPPRIEKGNFESPPEGPQTEALMCFISLIHNAARSR